MQRRHALMSIMGLAALPGVGVSLPANTDVSELVGKDGPVYLLTLRLPAGVEFSDTPEFLAALKARGVTALVACIPEGAEMEIYKLDK